MGKVELRKTGANHDEVLVDEQVIGASLETGTVRVLRKQRERLITVSRTGSKQ